MSGIRTIWKELDAEILRDGRTTSSAAIFRLMLLTGQRGCEVRSVKWSEIDFEIATWTLPGEKTKNKSTHLVPLSTQAMTILMELAASRGESPYIFPNPKDKMKPMKSFQKAVDRVRTASKVPYVGHDLRRTASSHMASIGIPPHVIKKILNHSEKQDITHIYNRYTYITEKREALQKWADYLYEVISRPEQVKLVIGNFSAKAEAPEAVSVG